MTTKGEPITISMAWGIHSDAIGAIGAIDVTLNCDTKLFIDPLLLGDSSDQEFARCAQSAYETRFETIASLLAASNRMGDLAERSARDLFRFHEVAYTHLGYSSGTSGSGFGAALTDDLVVNAKQAIAIGVTDPDLFVVLSLFEPGVGPDRISDMTTNIIVECLAMFTLRGCMRLGIETRPFKIGGQSYHLPSNPLKPTEPVLLVPKDIVRDLPVAADWSSVSEVAQETEDMRSRVSAQIVRYGEQRRGSRRTRP